MSEGSIENIAKSESNFAPTFADHHLLPDMAFNGHCLIKNNISIPKKAINVYNSYPLGSQLRNLNADFTLGHCLFGSEKLTKSFHLDKYKHTGCGIGFDSRSEFLITDGSYEKMSLFLKLIWALFVDVDNNGRNILILGEGSTQELHDRALTAKAKCPMNFTQSGKKLS